MCVCMSDMFAGLVEKACHWTGNWAAGSINGTSIYDENSPVGWTDYVDHCFIRNNSIDPHILKVVLFHYYYVECTLRL
jgi:hypothetical protein